MLDIQGPLITAALVAVIGAMVQVYSILQDRKRSKSKEAREEAQEPLVRRAMDLDNIDQYTVIQQRVIDSQGSELHDKDVKLAAALAENKLLRDQILDMFLRIREMERRTGVYEPPHSEDN